MANEYTVQNPKVIPAFLEVTKFENDTFGTAKLRNILILFRQLAEKLNDLSLFA